jgi:hypothetical protein
MDQNKKANINTGDQQRQGGQRPDQNRDRDRDFEQGAGGDRQNPNQPGKPGQQGNQGGQQGNQGGRQGNQGGNR